MHTYEQKKVNTHEDSKCTGTQGLEEIPFIYGNFQGNIQDLGCVICFVCFFCDYIMMQSKAVHILSLYICIHIYTHVLSLFFVTTQGFYCSL